MNLDPTCTCACNSPSVASTTAMPTNHSDFDTPCASHQECVSIDACEDIIQLKAESLLGIEDNDFSKASKLHDMILERSCTTQDNSSTAVCCNTTIDLVGEYIFCILVPFLVIF